MLNRRDRPEDGPVDSRTRHGADVWQVAVEGSNPVAVGQKESLMSPSSQRQKRSQRPSTSAKSTRPPTGHSGSWTALAK